MNKPICLWSGPRNVSTALMYSFAQRSDTTVVDEPLYGHYLRVSDAAHPGRDEIIAAMNCDGTAVMHALLARAAATPDTHLFIKHMAHHLVALELDFLQATTNLFLIRDPHDMLPSLTIQIPQATLADAGLRRQWELVEMLRAQDQDVVILDSRELLMNPAAVLQQLCRRLQLPFDAAMLHWPAGPRAEDGVWAPHWYHAVHQSTGFDTYRAKLEFPEHLQPLLDDCQPWYDKLLALAIRAPVADKKSAGE